jgi:hypothetical protein
LRHRPWLAFGSFRIAAVALAVLLATNTNRLQTADSITSGIPYRRICLTRHLG